MGAYPALYPAAYGDPFPQSILDLRAELLLGGIWTDMSPYLYQRSPPAVTVSRGHPDESVATNPTSITMLASNRDGRFSDLNPAGPWYGLIGQNTPVRISVPEGASYLRLESDQSSCAACPDSAAVSLTGSQTVLASLTLDNWRGPQALAGKWTAAGNQRSWLLTLNQDGTLALRWSGDGVTSQVAVSSQPVPVPPLGRQKVQAALDTTAGTVTFYTGATGSPLVQLGSVAQGTPGLVFDSTAPVTVGAVPGAADFAAWTGIYGKVHSLVLGNAGGGVVASPDFTTAMPGALSVSDGQGNAWALAGTAEISARRYRAHGEIASWPQAWDPTGTDVTVALAAGGLLRRLGQGTRPLDSAMYRYWVRLAGPGAPVAYWPCEDGPGSTQLASGLPGGQPGYFTSGSPRLASSTTFASSAPLPVLNSSTASMPVLGAVADNIVTLLVAVPAAGDTNDAVVASIYTTGTIAELDLVYATPNNGEVFFFGYNAAGTIVVSDPGEATGVNGAAIAVRLALRDDGAGGVNVTRQTLVAGGTVVSQTVNLPSASIGRITRIVLNSSTNTPGTPTYFTGTAIGHVAVQSAWSDLSGLAGPLQAWAGERAGARFGRLCGEEGIAFRGKGNLATSAPMGVQSQQKLTVLLQECADADRGVIFEPRQVLGLGYRCRSSLQNQDPAVALSYAGAHLAGTLIPARDDQYLGNDVTVSRTGGSSGRQQLLAGPLSVQPPPAGAGRYDSSLTLNVAFDSQCDDEAGWLVRMGTVNEPRYPAVTVDLARPQVASLFYDLQDLDLGDRVTVSGTPAWLPPDGISQIGQGVTEKLGGMIFTQDWNCVPESPYRTGLIGSTFRLDTDGSVLGLASSSSAQTIITDSGANAPWTAAQADFPFDIKIAGERMTVTNADGPPPNFLTGTASGSTQNAGFEGGIGTWVNPLNCAVAAVSVPAHSGAGALQMTSAAAGNMFAAHCANANILTQGLACSPGDVIACAAWLQAATAARSCQVGATFLTAAGAAISNLFDPATVADGPGWVKVTGQVTAPATAAWCKLDVQVLATGGAGEIHYADDAYLGNVTAGSGTRQTMTVTRSVNGVVKAQAAGAPVTLASPSAVTLT